MSTSLAALALSAMSLLTVAGVASADPVAGTGLAEPVGLPFPPPNPQAVPADKPPEAGGDPDGLVPLLPPGPGGDRAATRADPASGEFVCHGKDWVYVAAQPSGFVTGNCRSGTYLYRTSKSNPGPAGGTWEGGYVTTPGYGGCGWIRSSESTKVDPRGHTGCGHGSVGYRLDEYVARDRSGRYVIWSNGNGDDGIPRDVTRACGGYLNVRPWLSGRSWGSVYRTFLPDEVGRDGRPRLRIRYQTKYLVSGSAAIMVHDGQDPTGEANWLFVPASCFS